MALLTATEVTVLSSITASAATITSLGLIPEMQLTVCDMCNNYFLTDLYVQAAMEFDPSALTVTYEGGNWTEYGFRAGQDIYLYNSYENDGFYTIDSVSGSALTLISGSTIIDELSGASILVSVVKWPAPLKRTAAQMIAYDYDVRGKQAPNVNSRGLGPLSESFSQDDEGGYPKRITAQLDKYRVARMF